MKTWLHFIGKQYYTIEKYKNEAKKYGITRRIDRRQLAQMNFGDRVMLAMKDKKSSLLFGKFIINTISGLSQEESQLLIDAGICEKVSDGGTVVERGCGSYIEGATYVLNKEKETEISKIIEIITPAKQSGKIMIGGDFHQMSPERIKIDFRMGFRQFNYEKFLQSVAHGGPLKGHFYAKGDDLTNIVCLDEKRAQVVQDYKRKEEK